MLIEHPIWIIALAATAILVLLGFRVRTIAMRAIQICLLLIAMPLFAAFAAGDCASGAGGCGCGCDGGAGGECAASEGDYQAAVPRETMQATDEAGNKVDVHGSAVVGPVKTVVPVEPEE